MNDWKVTHPQIKSWKTIVHEPNSAHSLTVEKMCIRHSHINLFTVSFGVEFLLLLELNGCNRDHTAPKQGLNIYYLYSNSKQCYIYYGPKF